MQVLQLHAHQVLPDRLQHLQVLHQAPAEVLRLHCRLRLHLVHLDHLVQAHQLHYHLVLPLAHRLQFHLVLALLEALQLLLVQVLHLVYLEVLRLHLVLALLKAQVLQQVLRPQQALALSLSLG